MALNLEAVPLLPLELLLGTSTKPRTVTLRRMTYVSNANGLNEWAVGVTGLSSIKSTHCLNAAIRGR